MLHGFFGRVPPEIGHLPAAEIDRLAEEVGRRYLRLPSFRAATLFLLFTICGTFLMIAAGAASLLILTAGLAAMSICTAAFIWSAFRVQRQLLQQVLLEEGIRPRTCFECRFGIEAEQAHSCPRCGAALTSPNTHPVASGDSAPKRHWFWGTVPARLAHQSRAELDRLAAEVMRRRSRHPFSWVLLALMLGTMLGFALMVSRGAFLQGAFALIFLGLCALLGLFTVGFLWGIPWLERRVLEQILREQDDHPPGDGEPHRS